MPGEYIISKGDVGTTMFFITSGDVKIMVNG
jgi:CRP-like cAMP-binding protein